MRKITHFFSMLLLTLVAVGSVKAQDVTSLDQLSNTAAYTFTTENRGGLVYDANHPTQGWCSSNTTGGAPAYDVDPTNPNHQWAILTSSKGYYYFYNLGAKKFLYKDATPTGTVLLDAPTSTDTDIFASTGANKANYPWVLAFGSNEINLSTNQATAVITNWNERSDVGNMMKITKVADITAEDIADAVAAINTLEADLPSYVFSLDELSNTAVYTIDNARGFFAYDPDFTATSGEVTHSGTDMVVSTQTDGVNEALPEANKHWAILTSESTGNHYLYNVVAKKFVSMDTTGYTHETQTVTGTRLTADVQQPLTILNGEAGRFYPWVLAFGDNQLSISVNYTIVGGAITFWNDLTDPGNCVRFHPVEGETFDPTEAMEQIAQYEDRLARIDIVNEYADICEATLNIRGVGYPTVESEAYQTLAGLIADARANTDPSPEVAANLKVAEVEYRRATEGIQMPENGKYYYFVMEGVDGTQWLLNPTATDIAIAPVPETVPATATYKCFDFGEGKYAFITPQGKFFRNHSKYAGLDWMSEASTTGLSDSYDARFNNITVAKMTGDEKTSAALEDLFGFVTFYSVRGYDTGKKADAIGYTIIKTDGSDYDGGANQYFDSANTCAIRMIEVDTPTNFFPIGVTPAEDAEATALSEVVVSYPGKIRYMAEPEVTATMGETTIATEVSVSADDPTKLVITLGEHPAGELTVNVPFGAVSSFASQTAAASSYTFQVLEYVAAQPAQVVSYSPALDAQLDALPRQVVITFDKDMKNVAKAIMRTNMNFRGTNLTDSYPDAVSVEGKTITVNVPEEEIGMASSMTLLIWAFDADNMQVGESGYLQVTYEYTLPSDLLTFAGTSLDDVELSEPVDSMIVRFNSPYDGDFVGGFDTSKAIEVHNEAGEVVTTGTFSVDPSVWSPEAILTFAEAVSAPGTYTITVPAATVFNANYNDMDADFGVENQGAIYNPEFTISFTIARKLNTFTVASVTPDPEDGPVKQLDKVRLTFNESTSWDYFGKLTDKVVNVTDESGAEVTTCTVKVPSIFDLDLDLILVTPITTNGVYHVNVPEALVWNSNWINGDTEETAKAHGVQYNPAYTFTFTVDEKTGISIIGVEAADGNVYNVNGQLVGKSTKGLQKGVYIQNGKKIIRK